MYHEQAEAMANVLNKAAIRLTRRPLVRSFEGWSQTVVGSKRLRRSAEKIVKRWRLMVVAVPFASWGASVNESKRLQRAAERVLNRWTQMAMAVPYATWRGNAVERRRLARAAEKIVLRWRQQAMVCFDERAPCLGLVKIR
jgi:hypothetical protein